MEEYNPQQIESKWQKYWETKGLNKTENFSQKHKYYVLDMFPYPSGAGLHVGHPRGYIGTDIIARYKKMQGFNVLHPMGWDAFGLPAENYAIKTGIHPSVTAKENIERFKNQMQAIGLSYDWSREINTTDPEYYKWTQWIFLKLFETGLAYRKKLPINWCPSCKTGLANEEVVGGKCERCGAETTKKEIEQWVLKITDYAEPLLNDLEKVDWPEQIKEMQRNWIGRSLGAEIDFSISVNQRSHQRKSAVIRVFTTRPDTIFGASFMVLAPEHELVEKITAPERLAKVNEYQKQTKAKLDTERQKEDKEKTGVFIGSYAINPATNKKIPIYIADYVLPYYGYGAIMGVPAHDTRDYEFAKKYDLPVVEVIEPLKSQIPSPKFQTNSKFKIPKWASPSGFSPNSKQFNKVYEGEGILINAGEFNGMESEQAKKEIIKWLEKKGLAKEAINYKLRDWVFSRQRYWGEPIPLVFCEECKKRVANSKSEIPKWASPSGFSLNPKQFQNSKFKIQNFEFNLGEILNPGWVAMPEEELPLKLPEVEKYEPTGTGESPLASQKDWKETTCPKCRGKAVRETNTMPQWAGSCWYFLRYVDPKNQKQIIDKNLAEYWLPVDFYVGGAEHAVLHLLYSRFWIKVLFDAGIINFNEPFLKLRTIGLILAPDGQKMSKSRGNVVNPDDIIKKYGADVFRIYEMFMGPFDQSISWDPQGILGAQRFLQKVYRLFGKSQILNSKSLNRRASGFSPNSKLEKLLHKTIKKVTQDIEAQKFNTAIATMMELVNEMEKEQELSVDSYKLFVKLLAPFAPHMAEELYQLLNKSQIPNPKQIKSVFEEEWPSYDPELIEEEKISLVIQINGKVRDNIEVQKDITQEQAQEIALKSPKIQKWLKDKTIKKTIFVPDKLINFVV